MATIYQRKPAKVVSLTFLKFTGCSSIIFAKIFMNLSLVLPRRVRTIQASVPMNSSTEDLSAIIMSTLDVPPTCTLWFIYRTRILAPSTPLTSYGITNGSEIHVRIPELPNIPLASANPLPVPPPPPVGPDGVKDIMDPSLPDYVRTPAPGCPSVNPQAEAALLEMGYPLRKVRNALRVFKTADLASVMLEYKLFDDEDMNCCFEEYLCQGCPAHLHSKWFQRVMGRIMELKQKQSGTSNTAGTGTSGYGDYMSLIRQMMSGGGYGEASGYDSLFGKMGTETDTKVQEVGDDVKVSVSDIQLLFVGNGELTLEEEERVATIARARDLSDRTVLEDLVVTIRNALEQADATFRNPFALLYFNNSLAKDMFGKDLEYAATLNTAEVRFVVGQMKKMIDLSKICAKMRQFDNNLRKVEEALGQ